MKNLLIILFASFVALSALAGDKPLTKADYEKAVAKAKSGNKILLISYVSENCNSCKMMEQNSLSQPEVSPVLEDKFVFLKVDGKKGYGLNLSMKYRVSTLPSFTFHHPEGGVLMKTTGFEAPEDFLKLLNLAMNLSKGNKTLPGISPEIALEYPDFFRNGFSGEKVDLERVQGWQRLNPDIKKEVEFTVTHTFGIVREQVPAFYQQINDLRKLYGNADVEKIFKGSIQPFIDRAVQEKSEDKFMDVLQLIDLYGGKNKEIIKFEYTGNFLIATGHWDEFAAHIDRSINAELDIPDEMMNGITYEVYSNGPDGDVLKKAISWSKSLNDRNPDNSDFLYVYGALLFKDKQYDLAQKTVEKAISLGKKNKYNIEPAEDLLQKIQKTR